MIKKIKRFWFIFIIFSLLLISGVYLFNNLKVKAAETNKINIFPTNFSGDPPPDEAGWQNPAAVFSQDLGKDATFEEFNEKNSAYPIPAEAGISNFQFPISKSPPRRDPAMAGQIKNPNIQNFKHLLIGFWHRVKNLFTDNFRFSLAKAQEIINSSPTSTPELVPEPIVMPEPASILEPGSPLSTEPVIENQEEQKETKPIEKILELSNFSVSDGFEKNKIQNVQLRFSFAAKPLSRTVLDSKLIIEYQYNGTWQMAGEIIIDKEISNATNGGYFLYVLPIFENWEELGKLKIRFTYSSSRPNILDSKFSGMYLDAVWLEVEYEKTIEEEKWLDLEIAGIREIKGILPQIVVVKQEEKIWLVDLETKTSKLIGSEEKAAGEFSIGIKDNFVFWRSEDGKMVFAYDIDNKKYFQEEIPDFDPAKGERPRIKIKGIPWEVVVDSNNFYFWSKKTGEIFSDGNSEILETFRQKFNLDNYLTGEELNNLGFSIEENE